MQGPTHSTDASRLNREATAEALATVETGPRDALKGLCCKRLCAYAESQDDGGSRLRPRPAELAPGGGKAEDDHEYARSAVSPVCALPRRHESHVAGARRAHGRHQPLPHQRRDRRLHGSALMTATPPDPGAEAPMDFETALSVDAVEEAARELAGDGPSRKDLEALCDGEPAIDIRGLRAGYGRMEVLHGHRPRRGPGPVALPHRPQRCRQVDRAPFRLRLRRRDGRQHPRWRARRYPPRLQPPPRRRGRRPTCCRTTPSSPT